MALNKEQEGIAALAGIVAIAATFHWRKRRLAANEEPRTWRCGCGQAYAVRGSGRHRVYSVPGDGPVLGPVCVGCGEPLPAGHDAPA